MFNKRIIILDNKVYKNKNMYVKYSNIKINSEHM